MMKTNKVGQIGYIVSYVILFFYSFLVLFALYSTIEGFQKTWDFIEKGWDKYQASGQFYLSNWLLYMLRIVIRFSIYLSWQTAVITLYVLSFVYIKEFKEGNGIKARRKTGIVTLLTTFVGGIMILCSRPNRDEPLHYKQDPILIRAIIKSNYQELEELVTWLEKTKQTEPDNQKLLLQIDKDIKRKQLDIYKLEEELSVR